MITYVKASECWRDGIWYCYMCHCDLTFENSIQVSERKIDKKYGTILMNYFKPCVRTKDIFICLNCWKNNAGKDWMFE
jgi:hypothetical protein